MSKSSDHKLNLLVAYPYLKGGLLDAIKDCRHHVRFLLDSGAFTAWKSGKPIALDDYCRFLERLPITPWRYFTLDVVGDVDATRRNYETMLKRGFKPLPIFTRGSDPKELEYYFQTSDVVGIGGLNAKDGKTLGFLKACITLAKGRRLHWLGFTRMDVIRKFKPYMCDSSTYNAGTKYGSLPLYFSDGHQVQVRKEKFSNPHAIDPRLQLAIAKLGYDAKVLSDPKQWTGGKSVALQIGITSFVKMSLDVHTRLGTHLFLAATSKHDFENMFRAYTKLMEKKSS